MIFCFDTNKDALRQLHIISKNNLLSFTQFFVRYFGHDWHRYDAETMPSWQTLVKDSSGFGTLDACVMIGKSDNGRCVCVRWDPRCVGGSVLRWESEPPMDEAENDIYSQLFWASNMLADET